MTEKIKQAESLAVKTGVAMRCDSYTRSFASNLNICLDPDKSTTVKHGVISVYISIIEFVTGHESFRTIRFSQSDLTVI